MFHELFAADYNEELCSVDHGHIGGNWEADQLFVKRVRLLRMYHNNHNVGEPVNQ